MEPSIILTILFSAWGVITALLVTLLIYRSVLSSREDDQIFIDGAERHHFEEQQELIARMVRLNGPIVALAVVSAVLLLSSVSFWAYQGWMHP